MDVYTASTIILVVMELALLGVCLYANSEATKYRRQANEWKASSSEYARMHSALHMDYTALASRYKDEQRWHKETIGDLKAVCERRDALEKDAVGLLARYQSAQENYIAALGRNVALADEKHDALEHRNDLIDDLLALDDALDEANLRCEWNHDGDSTANIRKLTKAEIKEREESRVEIHDHTDPVTDISHKGEGHCYVCGLPREECEASLRAGDVSLWGASWDVTV